MTVKWADEVKTWTNLNPGWRYGFLGDEACTKYVDDHFRDQPAIHNFWHELNVTILRADFIRYLTMLAEGGVYSDMDTSCLKPIVDWIPTEFEEMDIQVVAGIEYDDNTYPMFARPISLCQWTLMAKPGHPVFQKVVARVIYHLEYLARIKHVELGQLKLEKKEVLDATGPGAFTDSVMEVISNHEGRRVEWKELSQLKQPKLYGDVLILPINAFAGNQKHSHSGDAAYGPKLVKHHFGRSWYTSGKPTKELQEKPKKEPQEKLKKKPQEELKSGEKDKSTEAANDHTAKKKSGSP
ncbi:Putative glycosyltransferase, DXD sugar-binding, nucleotide-diphospho-sugar transferase [Septoria linicola]|uniref:Glycosyltransferase, DXD sugar-binding, nucleotide-diphospho-sugar transferase n=1 Tax=Septoria linicola TaxID=215465 RepID=A0A9Q9AS82_9PEZI|nr:putative glycosyltransferase, DXD sugar-binding, nucleotide-diphospho-sugar transferase [Septoria linicola]USW54832.1 Putative glycosyltransferase, DXD sugar-binding, nucleotide-diphospho-sugar transferase [Septoria linicola]